MKKILLIILILFIISSIYFLKRDTKVYYVSIGDYVLQRNNVKLFYGDKLENYQNYILNDYRINDLISDIEDNKKIKHGDKTYTLNNLLIKADLIVLSVGMNDLLYYDEVNDNMNAYIDSVMLDIDKLLEMIRYYSKEEIYIYNYFGFSKLFLDYVNKRLSDIAINYNVKVIDISKIKSKKKLSMTEYEYIEKKLLKAIK